MIILFTRPILFNLFGVPIGAELIAHIIAFIVFFVLLYSWFKKENVFKRLSDFCLFAFFLLLFSFLFGRLSYWIYNWQGFNALLLNFFNPFFAGIKSWGMIFGMGLTIPLFVFISKNIPPSLKVTYIRKISDGLALYAGLSIFILRIGCFLDGHLAGRVSELPFYVYKFGSNLHPVGIYLALLGLVTFILLRMFFYNTKTNKSFFGKSFDGEVLMWFFVIYSFGRFWIEYLIVGHNYPVIDIRFLTLSISQIICILTFFLASFFLFYYCYYRARKKQLSQ